MSQCKHGIELSANCNQCAIETGENISEPESSIVVTSGRNVTEMVEQPKPKFTLLDLEAALDNIFRNNLKFCTHHKAFIDDIQSPEEEQLRDGLVRSNEILQELLATIARIKNDLDVIELPSDNNQAISDAINTEKSEFSVYGVQLIEHKKIAGVSLYTTVSKARKIRDILNSHYAQQRVEFEAKIVNYPVY